MTSILAKLLQLILPIFLDWGVKFVKKEIEKRTQKKVKDEERGKVNEKNLKRLKECQDAESCIIAARDAFNGTPAPASLPVAGESTKIPE